MALNLGNLKVDFLKHFYPNGLANLLGIEKLEL